MKLNLADFYLNHYLSTFPPSERYEKAPRLSPINSDSSSLNSEAQVCFGSAISSFPVLLLADNSAFMDLACSGSLGLVDRKLGPGISSKKQKSPEHYIVLMNQRSGVPLAVCALKSIHGPPTVRIYATKQPVVGQDPVASTSNLGFSWTDSYPLFPWAELRVEGEFPMAVYSLHMASGSEGKFEKEPSYRAFHPKVGDSSDHATGPPDISVAVIGRTASEKEYSGAALLSFESEGQSEPFILLSVAGGIDPALMICFASILDETTERTMRLQCDISKKMTLWRHRYETRER